VIPPLPQLDDLTRRLAEVYARDTDPAGLVIAALLAHSTALEDAAKKLQGVVDRAESHALELSRQMSVCASPVPVGWIA